MLTMYAKLFSRITESSLMEEPISVRYTFVMLLAIADPKGYVVGTDIAIARRLNMPVADFRECLVPLMSPDESSNSKEHEGRRVIESDTERGYWIVNYLAYRDAKDADGRREYMRAYMREKRQCVAPKDVAPVNSGKLQLTQAEAEAKAEEKAKKKAVRSAPALSDSEWIASLKTSGAYPGVDIDREIAKAKVWLTTPNGNGRHLTKAFITRWLNKCDRAVSVPSNGTVTRHIITPQQKEAYERSIDG